MRQTASGAKKPPSEAMPISPPSPLYPTLMRGVLFQVSVISFFLGFFFCLGLALMVHGWFYTQSPAEFAFGVYLIVVHILFHVGEFLVAAAQRPQEARPGAFMLLHSPAYLVAVLLSLLEFFITSCVSSGHVELLPTWMCIFRVSFGGSVVFGFLTLFFYSIRVLGMMQCGSNFSFHVQYFKTAEHVLVSDGLYAYLRHPAYFGWFWRTFFSQLILGNPVSWFVHTVVTWKFFQKRIALEEAILEEGEFFGDSYTKYKSKTIVGIPFIV